MPKFQYHGGSLWYRCQKCGKQFVDRGFDFDNKKCENCESLDALAQDTANIPQEAEEASHFEEAYR